MSRLPMGGYQPTNRPPEVMEPPAVRPAHRSGVFFEGLTMPKGCTMTTPPNACPILLSCPFGMKAVRDGKSLDRRPVCCPAVEIDQGGENGLEI